MEKMENKVHKALAVMNLTTGKVVNYRQLIQSGKHSKTWNTSAANKFGRLANGVGGRVKGTNTKKIIQKDNIPYN